MNINAALGPTNTGKTFYAIERMTSYQSGIIGLPLRLLTKILTKFLKGRASRTAMITGEERDNTSKSKILDLYSRIHAYKYSSRFCCNR